MDKLLEFLPFLVTIDGKTQANKVRLLEALILGLTIGWFVAKPYTEQVAHNERVRAQLVFLDKKVDKIDQQVCKIMDELYKPILGGSVENTIVMGIQKNDDRTSERTYHSESKRKDRFAWSY